MEPMESEEQIQRQMAETRASLTEKLETLEQKVVGTVENATTAVTETVDVIKDSVQETVATVNDTVKESVETVKDWVDVQGHVREHPWLAVGGSVAVGYCLGSLLGRSQAYAAEAATPSYPWMKHHHNGGEAQARPREVQMQTPETPSTLQTLMSTWAPEIDKLKGLALGVLFGTVREMVTTSMSGQVGAQLKDVFDSVTRKMGGEPIPSSDLPMRPEASDSPHERYQEEEEALWQGQRKSETGETAHRRW